MLLWISIGAALVMAIVLFRLFFKDLPDFVECLRLYFQPNLISLFRGEWQADWWASTKLGLWATVALAMGVATHYKLPQLFPGLAPGHGQPVYASESVPQPDFDEPEPPPAVTPTNTAVAPSPAPDHAARYGVKVGDTVEISALNRTIALRRATITAIDSDQITVRSAIETYTFRWTDINRLKPATKK